MLDEFEISMSVAQLESFVGNLPDEASSLIPVLHRLAQHPAGEVRAAVARKSQISDETVTLLSTDADPEVIESLVGAQASKLSGDSVADIINRNWGRVNRAIAQSVESYDQGEPLVFAQLLAKSKDPSVRAALARNSSTPKSVLRQLAKDGNAEVSQHAQDSLENRY